MISFDEAVQLIGQAARPLATEMVSLDAAHRRVLARPVIAQRASPFADVSAMDGYAVRQADLAVTPTRLRLTGKAFAGRGCDGRVEPGTTIRIFTGAPVPAGADWVVIQENVRRQGDEAIIESRGSASHIRRAGSDFNAGDVLVEPGALLTPGAVVAAAAADLGEVEAYRQPKIRLLATGDELAEPGIAGMRVQAIPESVSFGVAALARDWGGEPVGRMRLPDDLAVMEQAASQALADVDLLVVTGGASVGERDFAKAMFGSALELLFSKVAMKPGKPVWLGRVGETLVMGLPGNPTSALVTARLLLAPLLAGLSGRAPEEALRWSPAPLAGPLGPTGDRETFSRALWRDGRVGLLPNQDSGAQKMLVAAKLLVRRPAGERTYAAGDPIEVLGF